MKSTHRRSLSYLSLLKTHILYTSIEENYDLWKPASMQRYGLSVLCIIPRYTTAVVRLSVVCNVGTSVTSAQ